MQRGMNQTMAWLVSIFSASAFFCLGAFLISKYQPVAAIDQALSAKTHKTDEQVVHTPKKKTAKKHVKEKEKPNHDAAIKDGDVLRPDDVH